MEHLDSMPKRKIGVFDLDGTVYTGTLTFDVVKELLKSSDFEAEREKVREAESMWKERGHTESYWTYNKAILEVFEQVLPLVSPEKMEGAIQSVLSAKGMFCYAYATALIGKLKKEGRLLVAVSGSIRNIVEPFACSVGFDVIVASELEVVNGAYTGKRVSQTNKNKDRLLHDVVENSGATLEDSIGIGDTHRDISLLAAMQNPIAFNPNAALYEEAIKRGWKIVIERKNMIYELVKGADGYIVQSIHPIYEEPHQEHLH